MTLPSGRSGPLRGKLDMEIVLTFKATNVAIKAEAVLLQNNVDVRVMPVPSSIRAGCGLCLRLSSSDEKKAHAMLAQNDVPVEGVYRKESGGYLPHENGE